MLKDLLIEWKKYKEMKETRYQEAKKNLNPASGSIKRIVLKIF